MVAHGLRRDVEPPRDCRSIPLATRAVALLLPVGPATIAVLGLAYVGNLVAGMSGADAVAVVDAGHPSIDVAIVSSCWAT